MAPHSTHDSGRSVPSGEPELAGRLALVTGAGRGIGEAVVRALAARGCRVLATDADPEGVDALARGTARASSHAGWT